MGSLDLHLVGQAPSGTTYRLRDARVAVQGPTSSFVFSTENDPDQASFSADVEPGNYTATLDPGWRLERVDDTTAATVPAVLTSVNPAPFAVLAGERTTVPLAFRVTNETVTMGSGFDIVITVEEPPPPPLLVVATRSDIAMYELAADGTPALVRTIVPIPRFLGLTTSLSGVTVPFGLIIVGNRGNSELDYFGSAESGQIRPFSWIFGPDTEVRNPISVVAYNEEIYVSQDNGAVHVFPLGAAGEPRPTRGFGASASKMAVANGEIFLHNNAGDIVVYPTTADGSVTPTRVIHSAALASGSPDGLFVTADEIFVAVRQQNAVMVFPRSASGDVTPSRVLTGEATTLNVPEQVMVFGNELYVASQSNHIAVFPATASGNVAPVRSIVRSSPDGSAPTGMYVYAPPF